MARYYPSTARGNSEERKKFPWIAFSHHPSDVGIYDSEIAGDINSVYECAIERLEPDFRNRRFGGYGDAGEAAAYICVVTSRFLREPNFACDEDLPLALAKGVPVLAFAEERGIGAKFLDHVRKTAPNAAGRVWVFDKRDAAAADVPFVEKLEFCLTSIAEGDVGEINEAALLARAEAARSIYETDKTAEGGLAYAAAVIRAGDGLIECGAPGAAMDMYRRSVEFCRELYENHGTEETAVELWRSLSRAGSRGLMKTSDGKTLLGSCEACRLLKEAHRLSESIFGAEPDDRNRELVAVSLRQVGALYETIDDLDAAIEQYKNGLEICAELSFKSPVEEDLRRRAAACSERIGREGRKYGGVPSRFAFASAAERYRELIDGSEKPTVADRIRYAVLCRRMGDSDMYHNDEISAEMYYERSREMLLKTAKEVDDARVYLLLASIYDRECGIAFEEGDMESAVVSCIEASGLYALYADMIGTEEAYRRQAAALLRLGAIRKKQNHFSLAAKRCRKVVEIMKEPSYGIKSAKSEKLLAQCREEYESLRWRIPPDEADDADDAMRIDEDNYGGHLAQLEEYEERMERSRAKVTDGGGTALGDLIYECNVAVAIAITLEMPERARRACDECMDFVAKIAAERIEKPRDAYGYIAKQAYELGEICARNCLFNHAAKLYAIARELCGRMFESGGREQDRSALATACVSLGDALRASGQSAAAEDDYERVLKLLLKREKEDYAELICRAYGGLARVYLDRGIASRAGEYAERSYEAAKAYAAAEYCGETVSVLMESRLALSEVRIAEKRFDEARKLLDEIDEEYARFVKFSAEQCVEGNFHARYRMRLAELCLAEGQPEAAAEHGEAAVDEAYEVILDKFDYCDYITVSEAHSLLGRCLAKTGEREQALCNLNRAGVFGERLVRTGECAEAVISVCEAYLAMSELREAEKNLYEAKRCCLKAIRVCDTLPKQMRSRAVEDASARSRFRLGMLEQGEERRRLLLVALSIWERLAEKYLIDDYDGKCDMVRGLLNLN